MSRFYFKNTRTGEAHYSDEFGIYLRVMPNIPVSQRVVESYPVEGRDGSLTIDKGYYKDLAFPVEVIVTKQTGEDFYDQLDKVYNWLDGRGELNFETYLPGKHFMIKTIGIGDLSHIMLAGGVHTFDLLTEPFKHSPLQTIEFTGEESILNPSEIVSKPKITVYGTGNIDLIVNGAVTQLKAVDGYITIDSEAKITYKDLTPKNGDKIGPFPELKKGINTISTTGTVTNIKIETKWRWR